MSSPALDSKNIFQLGNILLDYDFITMTQVEISLFELRKHARLLGNNDPRSIHFCPRNTWPVGPLARDSGTRKSPTWIRRAAALRCSGAVRIAGDGLSATFSEAGTDLGYWWLLNDLGYLKMGFIRLIWGIWHPSFQILDDLGYFKISLIGFCATAGNSSNKPWFHTRTESRLEDHRRSGSTPEFWYLEPTMGVLLNHSF